MSVVRLILIVLDGENLLSRRVNPNRFCNRKAIVTLLILLPETHDYYAIQVNSCISTGYVVRVKIVSGYEVVVIF